MSLGCQDRSEIKQAEIYFRAVKIWHEARLCLSFDKG